MNRRRMKLAAICFCACAVFSEAQAVTITFDELTGMTVWNSYKGLNWNNFETLNVNTMLSSGYANGAVSQPRIAFNSAGLPASFYSQYDFKLESLYLTAAWNNGLNVEINGYKDSNLLYSTTLVVDTTGPTFKMLNWTGINDVEFSSFGGISAGFGGAGPHFALDNLTVEDITIGAPEPATWAMMLLGFVGIGVAKYRAARRNSIAG